MKSRLIGWLSVTVLATSAVAYAGAKYNYQVYVSKNADGSGYMYGTLGSTRNSSDTVSRLGCYYEGFTPTYGNYKYSSCYAYDGSKSISCGTMDPILNETISKLQGDSYLYVEVDKNGNCTRVQIGSQSYAAPKAP